MNTIQEQIADQHDNEIRAEALREARERIMDNRSVEEDGTEVTQGVVNAAALLALMEAEYRSSITPRVETSAPPSKQGRFFGRDGINWNADLGYIEP